MPRLVFRIERKPRKLIVTRGEPGHYYFNRTEHQKVSPEEDDFLASLFQKYSEATILLRDKDKHLLAHSSGLYTINTTFPMFEQIKERLSK